MRQDLVKGSMMGKQDKGAEAGKGAGERRPLDGLAQRLGALEESLTVVASELGVSAMPRFKRLDPESVYNEAVRRAQDVGEPLRIAIRKLDARLDELALAQAQIRRELSSALQKPEHMSAIAGIEAGLAALSARLDATVMPIDLNEGTLRDLDERIEKLSTRLDTVWQRFDDQSRANATAKALPESAAIDLRLVALEHRLEQIANKIVAVAVDRNAVDRKPVEPDPAALDAIVDERVSAARLAMIAHLENRLAQLSPPEVATDAAAIATEVSRQIQSLLSEAAAERADPLPLLTDRPADRGIELNPLVMSATERAIVRLTHRLEKLEEWKQANGGDSRGARGGRGIMGRLFET